MSEAFVFGAFRLLPQPRQLLRDGQPQPVGGRAFDLLEALLRRRGRTASKDELIDLVWTGRVVEENNLQVQVAALRRLLGGDAIVTVPGRGYRFGWPVQAAGAAQEAPLSPASVLPVEPAPELIGRDTELAHLLALLQAHPCVTLAGSAGIGKTRLAQAVLHAHPEAAWVDLSGCSDPAAVHAVLAQALDAPADAELGALLAHQPRLVVLDNAEHLLDAVAAEVQALHAQAPAARVLVTSQAPLRLPGEQVLQLEPLVLPGGTDLADASASSAVALFVARARAADRRFRLDSHNVAAVVDVCRRLDGIPLALELGAARVRLMGVQGLRERLDDRFALLTSGTRTRLPRHRTLHAALDWSHALLGDAERRVFRRMAVFSGSFGLSSAQAVGSDDALDGWAVLDALGVLVDRSLVVTDGAEPPRYRLLESARLFARRELDAAGETADRLRRHAEAMLARVHEVLDTWRRTPEDNGFRQLLRAELDNMRAACRWAETQADLRLGVALAEAAGWPFAVLNLHAEYLAIAERWLARLPADPEARAADPTAAALCLRVAALSKNSAHAAGLDAALAAAAYYRRSGDTRRLHECLNCAVAIGARRGATLPYEALLAEARALQRPDWPRGPLSNHEWARATWLLAAGRFEEALASHRAQMDRNRPMGALGSWQAAAGNAAGCLNALGRFDEAAALAQEALAALDERTEQHSVRGYVLAALAHAEAGRGRPDAVGPIAREALPLLELEGDHDLLLLPLALAAEAQGRHRHAARLAGLHAQTLARRGLRPWPHEARAWAAQQARLLQALGEEELHDEQLYGAGRPLREHLGG